jgi:NADH-quinone oxidoreductase subunit A
MEISQELSEFGKILVFMILGMSFILLGYAANAIIKKPVPNPIKNDTYECGEVSESPSRIPFNMRFYIIAIIFLLFDVELVFLFPWSTIFADAEILKTIPQWGLFNLIEMFVFIALLLLGLAYVWVKGDLEWLRPKINIPVSNANIPLNLYDNINQKIYPILQIQYQQNF